MNSPYSGMTIESLLLVFDFPILAFSLMFKWLWKLSLGLLEAVEYPIEDSTSRLMRNTILKKSRAFEQF